ncbi:hypothetical protein Pmar_PMAR001017 [Perkinsus marinus ATCC 50983]|uniref:Uncharacterized protein n=1 Tax=Perkinsus marinus (strain ATCC 50983 / TXsc) TaxID=423536 RepID=C5KTB5_PERM5|nr:hypothetical protein Pmar_PMAR001017 [Perkinsus marinus ATCC 50983]EER12220.1 hypothetical protein Pmar_PMAR001017 [Perkinsus marinus ATCC 50983]|eukprot:XP_002780425.1 hypothetical protein Pmar_PMAR001017 [Perkinsus marinus ATCC 50983]
MAFRFRREGDRIKHRMHEELSRYEFRLGDARTLKARQALLKDQKMAPTMQVFCDIKTNGVSTKGLNATKGADNRPEHGPLEYIRLSVYCFPDGLTYVMC